MLVLVTYDVSTESAQGRTRLTRVAKCCLRFGQRVQNSVFECVLDYANFLKLKKELSDIINFSQDSLRFYNLGNNYTAKIEHLGAKPAVPLEGNIII